MSNYIGSHQPRVLLKLKQVMERTGLSRSSIYNKLDAKCPHYDPEFPRQVSIGASSVAWVESEVEEWIESCIKKREESVRGR
ncbi:AlpA family transcriptional regulator [Billgrantia sulfidoxydans]|uniref:AlpA family transcriptional regulator n=1 Tax=Billgrantia sulfidoxydans TaxID=2733484 RepID=A0ABX7W640_9GAMM|nr:AlpA family transcriptional regulator [Halomonas sulfidoxydans]QTP55853.1 AlpA family transcriptional regulator [Halomonas sulfidoxydans]